MLRQVQEFYTATGGTITLTEPLAYNHTVLVVTQGTESIPTELADSFQPTGFGFYDAYIQGVEGTLYMRVFQQNYALNNVPATTFTYPAWTRGWIFENASYQLGSIGGGVDSISSSATGTLLAPCTALTPCPEGVITIVPPTSGCFCVLGLVGYCTAPPPSEQDPDGCGLSPTVFLKDNGSTAYADHATEIDGWGLFQTDYKLYQITSYGDPELLNADVTLKYHVSDPANVKMFGRGVFMFVTPTDVPLSDNVVEDNIIYDVEGAGLTAVGSHNITVRNNHLSYTGATALYLRQCDAPVVDGNTVYIAYARALWLSACAHAIVRNNFFDEAGSSAPGTLPYMQLSDGSHFAQIVSNRIRQTGPVGFQVNPLTGILLDSGISNTAVITNDLRGALGGNETWPDVFVDNSEVFTTIIANLPGGLVDVSEPTGSNPGAPQPDAIPGVIEVDPVMAGSIIVPDDPGVGSYEVGNSVLDVNPDTYGMSPASALVPLDEDYEFNNFYRFINTGETDAYWTLWLQVPVPEDVWTMWDETGDFWGQYPASNWTVNTGTYATIDLSCTSAEQLEWDAWVWFQNIRHGAESELLDNTARGDNLEDVKLKAAFSCALGQWARGHIQTYSSVLRGVRNKTLWAKLRIYVGPGKDLKVGRFRIPYVKGFVGYTTEYGGTPVPVGANGGSVTINNPPIAVLNQLTDVSISSPADTNILTYSGGVWVNAPAGTVSTPLDGIADVDAAAPNDNDLLQFDSASQNWVATAVPTGGSPWIPAITAPVLADFAWNNQGTATATAQNAGITLIEPGHGNASSACILERAAPSTPYTITAAFLTAQIFGKAVNGMGICWRQSSDSKLVTIWIAGTAINSVYVSKWTTPNAYSAHYVETTNVYWLRAPMLWLRMADNGSSRICSYSGDGITWMVLHTVARTDYLTADKVGFFVDAWNQAAPNRDVAMHLVHWAQT